MLFVGAFTLLLHKPTIVVLSYGWSHVHACAHGVFLVARHPVANELQLAMLKIAPGTTCLATPNGLLVKKRKLCITV